MKKKLSAGVIVIICVAAIVLWFISAYNKLVRTEETIDQAWSQVENVYQRRMDLIPNLINTVKGAADFERSTLENVINARSKASSVNIDPSNLTGEKLAAFEKAQGEISSALNKLMVVVERYPELKANQNFMELQAQLEGTENRITVERKKFNESVRSYNISVRKFPINIVAGIFGFEKKAYFKAEENAEKAVKVEFEF